tara:strand:- start:1978 stop:2193 length:216 start_codon:yes stop_codon:yes gene_type:complete
MAIMPKLKPGDLVELKYSDYPFLALVVKTTIARRRGESPQIHVEWCGLPPRIYNKNILDESLLTLVARSSE